MKISIIGKGNAGCVSALHFNHYGKFLNKPIEIETIHDSKIAPVPVGQAATLPLPRLMWQAFGSDISSKFSTFSLRNSIMIK